MNIKSGIAERAVSLLIAILIHALLLFFVVFTVTTAVNTPVVREAASVMKLADIREEAPRPSIPVFSGPAAAERVVESDDAVSAETVSGESYSGYSGHSGQGDTIDFFPMHLVSQLPKFSEDEIKRRVIYPPIAQRSELEGTVYLEIFVDREGAVRSVTILKEDPPGRGFGEAAAKAFEGLKGSPAMSNGEEVAVRYRYPVRFTLK